MTVIFWAVAVVAFVILELATVGLASIWFALGALCALIAALLHAPLWLQIVCFVLVSAATLLLTRPLAKKYINSKTMATNADRVIGSRAVELAGSGAVLADGKMWSARTVDGSTAEPGDVVIVREIRGVKLIVDPNSASASEKEATE